MKTKPRVGRPPLPAGVKGKYTMGPATRLHARRPRPGCRRPDTLVGVRLSELLVQNGWTEAQLARALGVGAQQVSRWVRGAVVPSICTLSVIDRLLATVPPR